MKTKIVFFLLFLLSSFLLLQKAICQHDEFRFIDSIAKGNYYLLQGAIDEQYDITMRLDLSPTARCGEVEKAIQWKKGGLDGWYYYNIIGKKIAITGSYLSENSVQLFVPLTVSDTIDAISCEMENHTEVFWNEQDFDLTQLQWRLKDDATSKKVDLEILHFPSQDTLFINFEVNNAGSKDHQYKRDTFNININKLDNDYFELVYNQYLKEKNASPFFKPSSERDTLMSLSNIVYQSKLEFIAIQIIDTNNGNELLKIDIEKDKIYTQQTGERSIHVCSTKIVEMVKSNLAEVILLDETNQSLMELQLLLPSKVELNLLCVEEKIPAFLDKLLSEFQSSCP